MDPDPEAKQTASQILTNSFIIVVFTSCTHYKTETTASVSTIQFSLPDSTHKTVPVSSFSKKKKKTIYLTFDDGPNKGTRKMMHIVQEEQVPVTLFIVGQHVYGSREQTATFDSLVACKYFEIANHSFTHAFENKFAKFYTVPDSALKDFIRCADSLHLTTNIIRTPGRNIWRTANISSTDIKKSAATADSLYRDGFTEVGWDLEWHFDNDLKLKNTGDAMLQQLDSMFTNGKTKTPNHLILLAHDQVYEDAADSGELHQFIKKLKATEEYNFEVVSKYPGLKHE
jgi:peptidoglycan/xylan/chitin deacetylase (PgdA/CDA1 family)